MAELFTKIEEKRDDMLVEVSLSFLEIYNEEIRDLLLEPGVIGARGGLSMREDKTNRIVVPDLTELKPKDADEVKEMVLLGNTRRTQSPTHANETSSRSHAVLQINVAQTPRTASTTEERTLATLSIIDLAGSERASATKNMGERMVEGANINKSLLALGNCINALCESGNRTRHVPYRNSKLTRLLKFSLGGNCKTVMIVCVAPTSVHFEDTQNTLKYANRAKDIKTKISRNCINVNRHVAQYVEAINRLNCEVAELKGKLAGKLSQDGDAVKRKQQDGKAEMERVRADLRSRAEQNKGYFIEVGACGGQLSTARARLDNVTDRLDQLEAEALTGGLPGDLEAERKLLRAMASSDEASTQSNSPLHRRMTGAGNYCSLFDAMLRAITERRPERMDESMGETVKAEVKLRKAEMEVARLQANEGVLEQAIRDQSSKMTTLIGMLARCTVMMKEGTTVLRNACDQMAMKSDLEDANQRVGAVAASLSKIAESNDSAFHDLVGQATGDPTGSSLFSFTSHSVRSSSRRSSVASSSGIRARRRSSTIMVPPSPAQRHRSPRRQSIRKSLASAPTVRPTRISLAAKPAEKKGIRWKDQAGEGSLADQKNISVVLPSPPTANTTAENEWEDESERKEDDDNVFAAASKENSGPSTAASTISKGLSLFGMPPSRKPRSGRFDPEFLKTAVPNLGALTEVDDESLRSPAVDRILRSTEPLGERSNQPMPELDLESRPSTPPPSSKSELRKAPSSNRKKRLSNTGPMKGRRRSSLIPRLSPPRNDLSSSQADRPPLFGSRSVSTGEQDLSSSRRGAIKKTRRLSALSASTMSLSNSVSSAATTLAKRPWRPSLAKLPATTRSPSDSSASRRTVSPTDRKPTTWR